MYFPVSGVECSPLVPLSASFLISLLCSPAGISGAVLLLPFQMSVLGYVSPGVSATNQVFNILACPAGIARFAKEGRFLLPLAVYMTIGTLPGVFIGSVLRLTWLAEARKFTVFMALVLAYLAVRMFLQLRRGQWKKRTPPPLGARCEDIRYDMRTLHFSFLDRKYHVSSAGIIGISLVVGIVSGIYGIGGGGIMAPFIISFFGLPVYVISGACLFATFLTSVAGAGIFALLCAFWDMQTASPDWLLGLLLGLGGMGGMYCGAALQKYIPATLIRCFFILLFLCLSCRYIYLAL